MSSGGGGAGRGGYSGGLWDGLELGKVMGEVLKMIGLGRLTLTEGGDFGKIDLKHQA